MFKCLDFRLYISVLKSYLSVIVDVLKKSKNKVLDHVCALMGTQASHESPHPVPFPCAPKPLTPSPPSP